MFQEKKGIFTRCFLNVSVQMAAKPAIMFLHGSFVLFNAKYCHRPHYNRLNRIHAPLHKSEGRDFDPKVVWVMRPKNLSKSARSERPAAMAKHKIIVPVDCLVPSHHITTLAPAHQRCKQGPAPPATSSKSTGRSVLVMRWVLRPHTNTSFVTFVKKEQK